MKAGHHCDFIVDTKSKVSWFAPDVAVEMQKYYDFEGGCKAKTPATVRYYSEDIVDLGDSDNSCMVKYYVTNHNGATDIKLQVYKMAGNSSF